MKRSTANNDLMLQRPIQLQPKFIVPLAIIYVMIYLAANSVAYKLVVLGPILEPGPPLIFPVTYLLAAIIAEVYGSAIAKQIIWMTLIAEILYALIVQMIIALPSPSHWHGDSAYHFVFGHIIHFVLSGAASVILSSFTTVYLSTKFKVLMNGRHYCLRTIASTGIGGFILVMIIMFFVYLPIVGLKQSVPVFFSIYGLELAYTILLVGPSWLICGLLKKHEQIDVYDYQATFNPFNISPTHIQEESPCDPTHRSIN